MKIFTKRRAFQDLPPIEVRHVPLVGPRLSDKERKRRLKASLAKRGTKPGRGIVLASLAALLLLIPSWCWAEPGAPMPDDVRRYAEQKDDQREKERINERAIEWIQEGRRLVSCQRFDGDVSKITICKATRDVYEKGTVLFWIYKDDRPEEVCDVLRIGDFIFRDNLCKQPQRSTRDPRKIWTRMMELGLLEDSR